MNTPVADPSRRGPASDPALAEERRYTRWKWWILIAVMGSYLFYYLGRFNLAICARPIAEEFGWSTGQVGRIISVLILAYGIGQFLNGQFADRFGRIMMPIGAVLALMANWGFSFAPQIGGALGRAVGVSSTAAFIFGAMAVFWGLNGFLQSTASPAGARWISNWWVREERGLANGLYSFAACMSTLTVFNLAAWCADAWGWRAAFRYPVILMAAVPITFYLLTKDYPEQVGLKSREADAGTGRRSGSLPHYLAALKHGGFMTACVSVSFHHAVRWGLLSFLPAFFMEVAGWKIKGAGFVASALPLGMGFGALAGGYISDKVFKAKRANTIFISMIFCAACAVLIPRITVGRAALRQADQAITSAHAQTAEHNLDRANDADTRAAAKARTVVSESRRPIAAIMLLISGFMLYTSIGPYFSLCPDLLGVNNTGTGYGIMNAFAYGGAAAGTFTISNLVERFGYNAMFLFLGGCALTAAMLIKLVREKDTA